MIVPAPIAAIVVASILRALPCVDVDWGPWARRYIAALKNTPAMIAASKTTGSATVRVKVLRDGTIRSVVVERAGEGLDAGMVELAVKQAAPQPLPSEYRGLCIALVFGMYPLGTTPGLTPASDASRCDCIP